MFRLKTLSVASVIALALSAAAAYAQPAVLDGAQPAVAASTDHSGASINLAAHDPVAAGNALGKIGSAIGAGVQAFNSGVHRATDQAADLIHHAMNAIGAPYRWGGTSAETGFDCSGFVRTMVQKTIGKLLPRRAAEQAAATQEIGKNELKPGDLVFFHTVRRRPYSHVGIYMGDGKFIHAPARGEYVRIDDLSSSYWQQHFEGARRVLAGNAAPDNLIQAKGFSGLAVSEETAADFLTAFPSAVSTGIASAAGNQNITNRADLADHATEIRVTDADSTPYALATDTATAESAMPATAAEPSVSAPKTATATHKPGNARRHTTKKKHPHPANANRSHA